MKIRIEQNVWGNVNGYEGNRKVACFSSATTRDLREWIAEQQAKGYVLSRYDVDIRLPEERQTPAQFFDILHDGRPVEIIWAHSPEHALAIRQRNAKPGVKVTASARHRAELTRARPVEPPAGPVPTGKRIEFSGLIVHTRSQESQYGTVVKMLVLLDNGSKVWSTIPAAVDFSQYTTRGSVRVWLRATVEASDDKSFGFASRPHLIKQETVTVEPLPQVQQK